MSKMEGVSNDPESELAVVDQEPQMISWRERDVCDANGISLNWGEYFVFEGEGGAGSDDSSGEGGDDEEECTASVEEAEEVSWEEVAEEEKRAEMDTSDHDRQVGAPAWLSEQGDVATTPSLIGMPDILLEKIANYATERPSQVCTLERVCRRFRGMAMDDAFWARYHRYPRGCVTKLYHDNPSAMLHWDGTRESSLTNSSIRNMWNYSKSSSNGIVDVLSSNTGHADAFRDVAADLVSQMIREGSGVSFRLRGDTVGYLAEMLQDHMIRKLNHALLFAAHCSSARVQEKDVAAALRITSQLPICNADTDELGSLGPSVEWRWPGDACHCVLPPETGRRIIRRVAFRAGIAEMSNKAFILAEEDLLHTLGVLLMDAIESSVEMGKSASYLDDDDSLVYGVNTCSLDMFKIPPPPFCASGDEEEDGVELVAEPIYTIVPGLIRASAERRNILPFHVYGFRGLWDAWVPSSGFTSEEEIEIEESYYYSEPFDDSSVGGDEKKDGGNTDDGTESQSGEEDVGSQSNEEDFDSSDDMDWEELNDISHVEARMLDGQDGWYLT